MKKLEDIPKKTVFDAPEGYFDRLPGIIQARLAPADVKREFGWVFYLRYSLRYGLPVLAIAVGSFLYLNKAETQSAEDLLASIDSVYLVAYLEDSDVSTDDLMESVSLDNNEANVIQQSTLDEINVDDKDVEALTNEFGIDYF